MFNFLKNKELSDSEQSAMTNEAERLMEENEMKQDDIKEEKKRQINAEAELRLQKGIGAKTTELEDVRKHCDYVYRKEMEILEQRKLENQRSLKEWKVSVKEQGKEMKANLKEEGERALELQKQKIQEESDRLDKLSNELEEKKQRYMNLMMKEADDVAKLENSHEESISKMTDKFRETLDHRQDALHVATKDGIKEIREHLEKTREEQKEFMLEDRELNERKLIGFQKALKARNADDKGDDFCSDLKTGIRLYNRVKTEYDPVERLMKQTCYSVQIGDKVKSRIESDGFLTALGTFSEKIDSIHQNLPAKYDLMSETIKMVRKNVDEIKDKFDDVVQPIEAYRKACKNGENHSLKCYVFDPPLKNLVESFRESFKKLGPLVLKFNIQPPNEFGEVADQQLKLSLVTSRLQIKDENSTDE